MGNRAVITTPNNTVGIYVHWNGGIESVLGFTHAANALDVRSPSYDPSYFLARLTQIIGNFFGGTTSVGIGLVSEMDSSDNGVWVVHDFDDVRQGRKRYSMHRVGKAKAEIATDMCAHIVGLQNAAFDDSDWKTYVKLSRIPREL